jgi:SAM-dependent methyltransferase
VQIVTYLDDNTPLERLAQIRQDISRLAKESPYGWGNTQDLGAGIRIEGVLLENYQPILARWRTLGWLPDDLAGQRVADIGGWNGGMTIALAQAGALVTNVEEIPAHARQFAFIQETLQLQGTTLITDTLYRMPWFPETRDLDLIVCAGVLYHLSDMIVGLKTLYDCLKAPGTLLIHTQAAPEAEFPHADFAGFAQGVWWQPSISCIEEMLRMVGFDEIESEPYIAREAIVRAKKVTPRQMEFKRGLNYPFANILDDQPRTMTPYHVCTTMVTAPTLGEGSQDIATLSSASLPENISPKKVQRGPLGRGLRAFLSGGRDMHR